MTHGPHVADVTLFWSDHGGGVRRYLLAKRHALVAAGGRHRLVVPRAPWDPPDPALTAVPGVPVPGSHGYRWPLGRQAMVAELLRAQPDVIECADPFGPAHAALAAARQLGVPAVAWCHSDLPALARQWVGGAGGNGAAGDRAERRAAAWLRDVYAGFDRVYAGSRHLQQRLLAHGIARVQLHPLGVDTAVFRPRADAVDWPARLGLPAGTRVAVYAGRLAPEKHLATLARAIDRLGDGHVLVTLGDGPAPARGARVVRRPFEPSADALAAALAGADVFVHAGDGETFGLAPLEAMACGVPVVARRRAGLAELVDDTVGAAVEDGTPQAFADAIAAVLARRPAGPDRRARPVPGDDPLAAAARQRALGYAWPTVLAALFDTYRALAAGPARRPADAGLAALRGDPQPERSLR